MNEMTRLIENYSRCHQHPINELIHFFAIPIIMFSIIGLMYCIHSLVAVIFIITSLFFYIKLSYKAFIIMSIWSSLYYYLIYLLHEKIFFISVVAFFFGWIIQFIGHYIEGKKPSFLDDVKYLWIGPLFVVRGILIKIGFRL